MALSFLVLVGTASALGAAPEREVPIARVATPAHHDTSPPLWLMPIAEPSGQPEWEHRQVRIPRQPPPGRNLSRLDPVRQSTRPFVVAMPTATTSFDGVGGGFSGPAGGFSVDSMPPDTQGDVGPNHYVHIVNAGFAVFNKSGTAVYGPVLTKTLWSGFGGVCETTDEGDGIVLYDQLADRWFITQFAFNLSGSSQAPPFMQCIAVSTSPDPTGSYNRYAFQYTDFPDYGKFGVWPDAYYATFNAFDTSNAYTGTLVCAYDRARMLSGAAATQQCINLGTSFGGLLPTDFDGNRLPPAGSPNYILGFDNNPASVVQLWRFHVDWATPANTTLTRQPNLSVATINLACINSSCVPQTGTTNVLDALGDRMMYRVAYRNFGTYESLVLNHTVATSASTSANLGIRWYEVRNPNGTPMLYQQGTYAPDSSYRWLGSIAQDQVGNMALGFSISSSSTHPGIAYTGRLATDALGTMTQGENTLVTGAGSQTTVDRWGDYSMMSVDPVDDCTFWFTSEYIPSVGDFNWRTRVGSFKFSNCPGVTNDFSVTVSPRLQTIQAGTTATYTVTTAVKSGTAQSIALTATNLPAGVTASFNPTTVTAGGSSTLTLTTTTSTASVDWGAFNVVGTSASATRPALANITVQRNDFTLGISPGSRAIPAGTSSSFTVTTARSSGTAETVTFSISGLPAGISYAFNPTSVTAGGSSTLTMTAASTASPTPSTTFTVTGTATSATHTVTGTVTIPSDFSLQASPTSVTVSATQPATVTLTTAKITGTAETIAFSASNLPAGVTASFSPAQVTAGGSATMTLSGTSSLSEQPGQPITITGTSPSTLHTTTVSVATAGNPTAGFIAPAPGKVKKTVTLIANGAVSASTTLSKVELYVDDTLLTTGNSLPYSYDWDTTTVANGSHVLHARVYDAAGDSGQGDLTVTVFNIPPPTVTVTAPRDGETVKATYNLQATAVANGGATIINTEFYIDNTLVGTAPTAPLEVSWNTTQVKDGIHVLVVKGYDSEGQVTASTAVSFKVANSLCGCSSGGGAAGTGGLLAMLLVLRRLGARRARRG